MTAGDFAMWLMGVYPYTFGPRSASRRMFRPQSRLAARRARIPSGEARRADTEKNVFRLEYFFRSSSLSLWDGCRQRKPEGRRDLYPAVGLLEPVLNPVKVTL